MKDKKREHEERTYILTYNLGPKIRKLTKFDFTTPKSNDPFYSDLYRELISMLKDIFPNDKVIGIDMNELSEEIIEHAVKIGANLYTGAHIVSTCTEIAYMGDGSVLHINRMINERGNLMGLGSRPGYPDLDYQIHNIVLQSGNKPIIIVEDGSFTGDTLSVVTKKFQERGCNVLALIMGFIFPKAQNRLIQEFKGEIIVTKKIKNPIDWMPVHDFIPFAPNCGRVLGVMLNGIVHPFYDYNGATYSVPYLYPYCPIEEWASIPKEYGSRFSLFCHQRALELFRWIENKSKKKIKIIDLSGVLPKISVPISVKQKKFPNIINRVTDFLSETSHEF